jgi:hypothetical protein
VVNNTFQMMPGFKQSAKKNAHYSLQLLLRLQLLNTAKYPTKISSLCATLRNFPSVVQRPNEVSPLATRTMNQPYKAGTTTNFCVLVESY